jgi:hypothetical protein
MRRLGRTVIGGALMLGIIFAAGEAQASDNVGWQSIIGIIQPGNVVAGIPGAGEPWSTLGGSAFVDLQTGEVQFQVRGLVLAGGNGIGTTGGATQVGVNLVCNPSSAAPTIFRTGPSITLDAQGNASTFFSFGGATAACTSVAFLIDLASGQWIAYGAVPFTSQMLR